MNQLCRATKRNGEGCTLPATGQQGFCWAHDPAHAATRKRTAARGGKARAARKVAMIWDEVREVIDKVEAGTLTPPQANTMLRGYNTLIGQRRLELDEQERLEILPRLELLEDQSGKREH